MQLDEAQRAELNRHLAALADGDRRAFDPAYRTLWPLLVRFIAAISGDPSLAEEIAQRAMLKIFSRIVTFDSTRDGLAWSMTIALNEYRSYRRQRANSMSTLDESALAQIPESDTPEAMVIRGNLQEAAREILAALGETDRQTIIAALFEESRPSVSAAAFRKRLQRAVARARQLWQSRYGDDRA